MKYLQLDFNKLSQRKHGILSPFSRPSSGGKLLIGNGVTPNKDLEGNELLLKLIGVYQMVIHSILVIITLKSFIKTSSFEAEDLLYLLGRHELGQFPSLKVVQSWILAAQTFTVPCVLFFLMGFLLGAYLIVATYQRSGSSLLNWMRAESLLLGLCPVYFLCTSFIISIPIPVPLDIIQYKDFWMVGLLIQIICMYLVNTSRREIEVGGAFHDVEPSNEEESKCLSSSYTSY